MQSVSSLVCVLACRRGNTPRCKHRGVLSQRVVCSYQHITSPAMVSQKTRSARHRARRCPAQTGEARPREEGPDLHTPKLPLNALHHIWAFCGSQARTALFNSSRAVRHELLVNLAVAPVTVTLRDGTNSNMRAGMGFAALLPRPQRQKKRSNTAARHPSGDTLAAAAAGSYKYEDSQLEPTTTAPPAFPPASSTSASQLCTTVAPELAACLPRTVTIRSHAARGLAESRFLLCLSGLLHGAHRPSRGLTPLIGPHVRHLVLRGVQLDGQGHSACLLAAACPKLARLTVVEGQNITTVPTALVPFTSLRSLRLVNASAYCIFSNEDVSCLSALTRLTRLEIHDPISLSDLQEEDLEPGLASLTSLVDLSITFSKTRQQYDGYGGSDNESDEGDPDDPGDDGGDAEEGSAGPDSDADGASVSESSSSVVWKRKLSKLTSTAADDNRIYSGDVGGGWTSSDEDETEDTSSYYAVQGRLLHSLLANGSGAETSGAPGTSSASTAQERSSPASTSGSTSKGGSSWVRAPGLLPAGGWYVGHQGRRQQGCGAQHADPWAPDSKPGEGGIECDVSLHDVLMVATFFPSLTRLHTNLRDSAVEADTLVDVATNCPGLRVLSMPYASLQGVAAVPLFTSMPALTHVALWSLSLPDPLPARVIECPNLKCVNIAQADPVTLSHLPDEALAALPKVPTVLLDDGSTAMSVRAAVRQLAIYTQPTEAPEGSSSTASGGSQAQPCGTGSWDGSSLPALTQVAAEARAARQQAGAGAETGQEGGTSVSSGGSDSSMHALEVSEPPGTSSSSSGCGAQSSTSDDASQDSNNTTTSHDNSSSSSSSSSTHGQPGTTVTQAAPEPGAPGPPLVHAVSVRMDIPWTPHYEPWSHCLPGSYRCGASGWVRSLLSAFAPAAAVRSLTLSGELSAGEVEAIGSAVGHTLLALTLESDVSMTLEPDHSLSPATMPASGTPDDGSSAADAPACAGTARDRAGTNDASSTSSSSQGVIRPGKSESSRDASSREWGPQWATHSCKPAKAMKLQGVTLARGLVQHTPHLRSLTLHMPWVTLPMLELLACCHPSLSTVQLPSNILFDLSREARDEERGALEHKRRQQWARRHMMAALPWRQQQQGASPQAATATCQPGPTPSAAASTNTVEVHEPHVASAAGAGAVTVTGAAAATPGSSKPAAAAASPSSTAGGPWSRSFAAVVASQGPPAPSAPGGSAAARSAATGAGSASSSMGMHISNRDGAVAPTSAGITSTTAATSLAGPGTPGTPPAGVPYHPPSSVACGGAGPNGSASFPEVVLAASSNPLPLSLQIKLGVTGATAGMLAANSLTVLIGMGLNAAADALETRPVSPPRTPDTAGASSNSSSSSGAATGCTPAAAHPSAGVTWSRNSLVQGVLDSMQLAREDVEEGKAQAEALQEAVDDDPVLVAAAEDRAHVIALATVTAVGPALQQLWGIPFERSTTISPGSGRRQDHRCPLDRMVAAIREPMRNAIFALSKAGLVPLGRLPAVLKAIPTAVCQAVASEALAASGGLASLVAYTPGSPQQQQGSTAGQHFSALLPHVQQAASSVIEDVVATFRYGLSSAVMPIDGSTTSSGATDSRLPAISAGVSDPPNSSVVALSTTTTTSSATGSNAPATSQGLPSTPAPVTPQQLPPSISRAGATSTATTPRTPQLTPGTSTPGSVPKAGAAGAPTPQAQSTPRTWAGIVAGGGNNSRTTTHQQPRTTPSVPPASPGAVQGPRTPGTPGTPGAGRTGTPSCTVSQPGMTSTPSTPSSAAASSRAPGGAPRTPQELMGRAPACSPAMVKACFVAALSAALLGIAVPLSTGDEAGGSSTAASAGAAASTSSPQPQAGNNSSSSGFSCWEHGIDALHTLCSSAASSSGTGVDAGSTSSPGAGPGSVNGSAGAQVAAVDIEADTQFASPYTDTSIVDTLQRWVNRDRGPGSRGRGWLKVVAVPQGSGAGSYPGRGNGGAASGV